MRLPWFIFIVLLSMCVVVAVAFVTPQVPYEDVVLEDGSIERVIKSHGFTHDRFSTMRQGGPGAERHAVTLWIGWAFVTLQVLFFGGCLAMGMTRHGTLGPTKSPLIFGTLGLAAIFAVLVFSYYRYMNEPTHTLFLGFPRPSAWMLYAVWVFPVFFMVLYYRMFDRWFFTAEDADRLEEIAASQRQSNEEGA